LRKAVIVQHLKTKVSTPRIVETQRFYERVFGMVVAEEWESPGDRGVILKFPGGTGEALLEIYYAEDAFDLSGVSLQFKVETMSSFMASLPADISYEGPKPRPWGSTYLYLQDPAGVQIIVYEGGL
ncbi:MAG: VOC family protein, partial [Pseudomonadota bacterium]